VTIAVVHPWRQQTAAQDLATFGARHGEPLRPGQFTQILPPGLDASCEGTTEGPFPLSNGETGDVEVVHAMAPDARIVYVGAKCDDGEGTVQDLDALTTIVDQRLTTIVSNSWAAVAGDATLSAGLVDAYQQIFTDGAAEGVGFYFSAGDFGAHSGGSAGDQQTLLYPQSDPWVTSVGETVSGGSGQPPAYLEGPGGGTSLACPQIAGMQADAQQATRGTPIGFADPAIYARYGTVAYHDVTDDPLGPGFTPAVVVPAGVTLPGGLVSPFLASLGMDEGLSATPGYDDATGVGTGPPRDFSSAPAPPRSSGGPRIDDVYSGFQEVFDVPGCQGRTSGPADGRDLGVEALSRQPPTGTTDHDRAEPGGRWSIKRLDEVAESGEEIRRGRQQTVFPPSVREALDAMADLGDGDRRGGEFVSAPAANPLPHAGIGLRPHQL
jgi:hypothetical protein